MPRRTQPTVSVRLVVPDAPAQRDLAREAIATGLAAVVVGLLLERSKICNSRESTEREGIAS